MSKTRKVLAFVLSPIAVTACVLVLLVTNIMKVNVLMAGFLLIFIYVPFLAIGIPAVNFLEKIGRLSFLNFAAIGGVVGALSFICLGLLLSKILGSHYAVTLLFKQFSFGAGIGILTSAIFGIIAGLPFLRR